MAGRVAAAAGAVLPEQIVLAVVVAAVERVAMLFSLRQCLHRSLLMFASALVVLAAQQGRRMTRMVRLVRRVAVAALGMPLAPLPRICVSVLRLQAQPVAAVLPLPVPVGLRPLGCLLEQRAARLLFLRPAAMEQKATKPVLVAAVAAESIRLTLPETAGMAGEFLRIPALRLVEREALPQAVAVVLRRISDGLGMAVAAVQETQQALAATVPMAHFRAAVVVVVVLQ